MDNGYFTPSDNSILTDMGSPLCDRTISLYRCWISTLFKQILEIEVMEQFILAVWTWFQALSNVESLLIGVLIGVAFFGDLHKR